MTSQHHSFDIEYATTYGIEGAIMIHHMQHWIRVNRTRKRNFHEGRTWMYQTIDDIVAHFPYWTRDQVYSILDKLVNGKDRRKQGPLDHPPVLLKGNFNKTPFDRTSWYSFVIEDDFLNKLYDASFDKIKDGKSHNQRRQNPTPIPDTKTDTKTNIVCTSDEPKPEKMVKRVSKKHPEGYMHSVSLEEIFSHAVLKGKSWDSQEIGEAWRILEEYPGLVREFYSFIGGTIKNIRNQKKGKAFETHKEDEKCSQKNESESSEKCKRSSSDHVTAGSLFPEFAEARKI